MPIRVIAIQKERICYERSNEMERAVYDFLEERISDCQNQQRRLQNENRGDEANFEKIKENVYDIFKTVLAVAIKKYEADDFKAKEFFQDRLEQIPSKWMEAYEKAKQHDDIENMHIESVKLSIVRDIRENMFHIWEEEK